MSADTQKAIVKKAGELFFKFGIRSVSIDDICKALGMSKKTFYVYFSTKDELVEALLEQNIEFMHAKINGWMDKPIDAVVREVIERQESNRDDIRKIPQLVFDLQKYYPVQFAKFQEHMFNMQREIIGGGLQRGVDSGLFRKDMDVDMTAILFAKLHSDMIQDAEKFEGRGIPMLPLTACSVDIMIRGILSNDGYKQIYGNKKETNNNI